VSCHTFRNKNLGLCILFLTGTCSRVLLCLCITVHLRCTGRPTVYIYIYIYTHCPQLDVNLMRTRVWYHGANTARKITETFAQDSVYNAIEVDISSMDGILRLAHDPGVSTVDTTLANFLDIVKTLPIAYTIKFDFNDEFSMRTHPGRQRRHNSWARWE